MRPAILTTLGALALSACSLAGDMTPPPSLATAQAQGLGFPPTLAPSVLPDRLADTDAGAVIYFEKCSPCHGEAGGGDGPQAAQLPNPPTAFTDLQVAQRAIPEAWFEVVTEGRFDRFMPGFSSLSDDQRWDVVGYALSLSLPRDQVQAGETLFGEACAACHGDNGAGDGQIVDLTSPTFQSGRSWLALYGAISQGVGDSMPAYADTLSDDERWAAAAFVRSLGLTGSGVSPVTTPTAEPTVDLTAAGPTPDGTISPQVTPTEVVAGVMVQGEVVNGTSGGGPPSQLEVSLRGFDGGAEALAQTTTTDTRGRYQFPGIEVVAGRQYVLTTTYQDVLYASEIVEIPGTSATLDVPLQVFETTTNPDAIRVSRLHLLFDFPAEGVVQVVELWLLSNLGERTVYEPETGALEIELPEGATGLSLDGGTVGDRYELTSTGFRDRRPLTPGDSTGELVFSYNLPYTGRMEFARPVAYPVDAVVVLSPEGGPIVSGDGVEDRGVRDISGAGMHNYALPAVPAGGVVTLTLSGRIGGGLATPANTTSILFGLAGLALIAVAAVLFLRRPPPTGAGPKPAPVSDDTVLWAIASLDNEFAAGRLAEDEYRRRRDELLRQAAPGSRP